MQKKLPEKLPHLFDSKNIALCLSGGGYRAALFHLGVLRFLHRIGVLQNVKAISSVSGGSIISAHLVRMLKENEINRGLGFIDWEKQVSAPFREFVQNDIRTIPFITHLLWNWKFPKFRANHLEKKYKKKLTSFENKEGEITEIKLKDLPQTPKFIFNTANLTFGINWEFRRIKSGDYQIGYSEKISNWSLARAVMMSSCFPPIFGPVELNLSELDFKGGRYKKADQKTLLSRTQFTDGGVYDNLGLEPIDKIVNKNRAYDTVLVSDGGQPFAFDSPNFFVSKFMRYVSNTMNQVAGLRKQNFYTFKYKESTANNSYARYQGAYFGIGNGRQNERKSPFLGYSGILAKNVLAGIRTDLDHFTEEESQILENHGYFVAMMKLAREYPNLDLDKDVLNPPHIQWVDENKVKNVLKNSGSRLSLKRLYNG